MMFEIVQSLEETDIQEDFVALGYIDLQSQSHSGFIIQVNRILYLFHYDGKSVDFEALKYDFYHKRTHIIHKDEVPAFIAYSKQVQQKANPRYGYFYGGEMYDRESGEHFGKKDLGERMTCVGFCLNVLKGWCDEDYLKYEDWSDDSHKDPEYFKKFCTKHSIDPKKIKKYHRRITPIEFLSSGFFHELPISKEDIYSKIGDVEDRLSKKQ